MSEPLVIDDVEHRLEGARIHLRLAQERATVTLDGATRRPHCSEDSTNTGPRRR